MQLHLRCPPIVRVQRHRDHGLGALFRGTLHAQPPAHAAAALAAKQQPQLSPAQKAAPVFQPGFLAALRQTAAIVPHSQLPHGLAAAQQDPHRAALAAGTQRVGQQMQTQQLHIIPVSQHTAGRPAAVVQLQGDSQLRTHHVGLGRHLLQQLAQIQRVKLRRLPGTQKFQRRQQFVDGPFQLGRGRADVADCLQGLGVCPHAGQMLLQILAVAPDQPQRMEAGILHRLLRDGLRRQLLRCILLCLLHCYRLQDCVRYSLLFCWMRYRLIA